MKPRYQLCQALIGHSRGAVITCWCLADITFILFMIFFWCVSMQMLISPNLYDLRLIGISFISQALGHKHEAGKFQFCKA